MPGRRDATAATKERPVNRINRVVSGIRNVHPYWRLLWTLAALGAAAVGIAAPGETQWP